MTEPYDWMKATFCIYCQHEYSRPQDFRAHVLAKHKETIAYWNLIKAINTHKAKGRERLEQRKPSRRK